jgi:hypothetical protein
MQCFQQKFRDVRAPACVAFLTVLYSRKFLNSKFEDDSPQAEYFARVEKDFVSAK